MDRLINAPQENGKESQTDALKQFIRVAIDIHRIRRVIIIVCDSPPRGEDGVAEYRLAPVTLVRQAQFLERVLPQDVKPEYIIFPHTSRYSGTKVVDEIRDVLQSCPDKAMLISTAVDRVTRRLAGWQKLQEVLREGDHMAVSLLWDTKTNIKSCEAMLLPAGV